jgi:hypothetical protein
MNECLDTLSHSSMTSTTSIGMHIQKDLSAQVEEVIEMINRKEVFTICEYQLTVKDSQDGN